MYTCISILHGEKRNVLARNVARNYRMVEIHVNLYKFIFLMMFCFGFWWWCGMWVGWRPCRRAATLSGAKGYRSRCPVICPVHRRLKWTKPPILTETFQQLKVASPIDWKYWKRHRKDGGTGSTSRTPLDLPSLAKWANVPSPFTFSHLKWLKSIPTRK